MLITTLFAIIWNKITFLFSLYIVYILICEDLFLHLFSLTVCLSYIYKKIYCRVWKEKCLKLPSFVYTSCTSVLFFNNWRFFTKKIHCRDEKENVILTYWRWPCRGCWDTHTHRILASSDNLLSDSFLYCSVLWHGAWALGSRIMCLHGRGRSRIFKKGGLIQKMKM